MSSMSLVFGNASLDPLQTEPLSVANPVVTPQCCVPFGLCGEVECFPLASTAACQALARGSPYALEGLRRPTYRHCAQAMLGAMDGLVALPRKSTIPSWGEIWQRFVVLPTGACLLMLLLWYLMGNLYQTHSHRSHFRRFILDHLGCLDQPLPRIRTFMAAMSIVQICASFGAVSIFIFNSYWQEFHPIVFHIERCLGVWFAFHYMVSFARVEFKLSYFIRSTRMVDVITIPGMLLLDSDPGTSWLTLGYLRSLSALASYRFLHKLGVIRVAKTAVYQEIILLILKLSTLVICFASSALVLEIIGDIPLPEMFYKTYRTGMGDISFFIMIYWAIETISTVGFGDFTPKTVCSRLVAVVTMVSGVTVFTLELSKVFDIAARQKKGSGTYQPSKKRHHVVLMGGGVSYVDASTLKSFLTELYHPAARNDWPNCIVMTSFVESAEKVNDLLAANLTLDAQSRVIVLVGSAFHHADLLRCGCSSAKMVFFLCDMSGSVSAIEEDKANILRALSLQNAFPDTSYRLMLLTLDSKKTALSLGISPERCFSVSEVTSGMLWLSCRGIGWNTFFANIVMTSRRESVSQCHIGARPFLADYIDGMHNEFYGFLPSLEFSGKNFKDLILKAYEEFGIIVIGAQIDGQLELAPLRKFACVTPETVFFAIAKDEESLWDISRYDADWKAIFKSNRDKNRAEQPELPFRGFSQKNLTPHPVRSCSKRSSDSAIPFSNEEVDESLRAPLLKRRSKTDAPDTLGVPRSQGASFDDSAANSTRRAQLRSRSVSTDKLVSPPCQGRRPAYSTAAVPFEDDLYLITLEERVEDIKSNAINRPFVLLINLAVGWDEVGSFISLDGRLSIPFRMPIVVLCPTPPSKQFILAMDLLDAERDVGIIVGRPSSPEDMIRSGVKECSIIGICGQLAGMGGARERARSEMLDADVLMAQRMIRRLNASDKHMVLEFNQIDNIRLLPRETRMELGQDEGDFYHLNDHFMSGRVFFPRMLSSWLAQAYRKVGLTEMTSLLWGPPADNPDQSACQAWQVRPRPEQYFLSIGSIFRQFLMCEEPPCLLVGILRPFDSNKAEKGYVWTNPGRHKRVRPNDLLFVFGDAEFGSKAFNAGLLPFSGRTPDAWRGT